MRSGAVFFPTHLPPGELAAGKAIHFLACVQTSPISFVARGKGTCNKGNRRRLHAGNTFSSLESLDGINR